MESLGISNQTLKEFIDAPFGVPNKQKHLKYEDRYQSYKKNNKIRIESTIEYEKNYFIHLQVPSESQKGLGYYDVVIQFFAPNDKVERELSVENYCVQFFSNSPGFVYKYASLYKLQGYLIESLYDKFEVGTLETLPDKANNTYELFYDSSIYYASRYLLDTKFFALGKLNLKIFKTKTPQSFFKDIQDVESINISRSVNNIEQNLKKEIEKDKKLSEQQQSKLIKKSDVFAKELHERDHVKHGKKSTFKDSSMNAKVITGKKTTTRIISSKKKNTAKKSTFKK